MYRSYKHAELEVQRLMLKVENHWIRLQAQIEFMGKIWNTFAPDYQDHQSRLLRLLEGLLQEALVTIAYVVQEDKNGDLSNMEASMRSLMSKQSNIRRLKYAFRVKDRIAKTLADLKEWHDMFDPGWFLLLRNSSSSIDQQLAVAQQTLSNGEKNPVSTFKDLRTELQHIADGTDTGTVFILETRLHPERTPINHSSASIAWEQGAQSSLVLVDTIRCPDAAELPTVSRDVRDFARVLSKALPQKYGLLPCRGVVKTWDATHRTFTFEFIFGVPDGLDSPQGLREILMAGFEVPLNERFLLAKLLARSVMFIHASNFVHKNIRPETIVCLQNGDLVLGSPFLMGFEKFRFAEGKTWHQSDNKWERNLYRHPKRQGKRPEEDYRMQHDIYSVGVILLEIGLWTSFVRPIPNIERPEVGPEIQSIHEVLDMNDRRGAAFEVQRALVGMAKNRLPSKMGQRYTQVVVDCLTCLDNDSAFGDQSDFEDQDGTLVGVRYIDKVGYCLWRCHCGFRNELMLGRFCSRWKKLRYEWWFWIYG